MPQDLEQQFITFYADHRQGRLSRAEKGYQSLLAAKPDWGPVLAALGNLYLDRDTPEKARPVLEKAAALDPPDLSACYSLGRLKQLENDHQGAIPLYRKILDRKPGSGLVWNNLGVAFRETGRPEKAMAGFESAVRLAPELAEAWNNLGVAQDEQRLAKKARKSYQTAIDLQPDYISPHLNLGILHQKAGRFKAAEAHYDRVLKIQPDHEIAIFMRQSIRGEETPDAAPVEHVRSIFNQCADNFETILVRDLKYRTPELLFNLVRPWLTRDMTILDLGCGTGLGAQLYRPFSRHLSGVDVSENMLKKAWEKKIYDHLELFDVLQEWRFEKPFDLIYSSDVFVYFGRLEPIISSAARALARNGIIAFSVEELKAARADYRLNSSGRYAHSRGYLHTCLVRCGLTVIKISETDIRNQSGEPVSGILVAAQKQTEKGSEKL